MKYFAIAGEAGSLDDIVVTIDQSLPPKYTPTTTICVSHADSLFIFELCVEVKAAGSGWEEKDDESV